MSIDSKETPAGVVAIIVDDTGRVVGRATDFSQSRPGGYRLIDAQKRRAVDAATCDFVARHCSNIITDALSQYDVDRIVEAVMTKNKIKIETIIVGDHPDKE
jgi:hypothetical protein